MENERRLHRTISNTTTGIFPPHKKKNVKLPNLRPGLYI